MDSGGEKTVRILRRMKRKSISHWPWKIYEPAKGLPEELAFNLIDENERIVGEIIYGKASLLKGVDVTTPWGLAKVEWPKLKVRISLAGQELVRFDMSWLGGKTDFIFRDGVVMQFTQIKGRRCDIEYSAGKGSASFCEEEGTLYQGYPGLKVQMTEEEIKRLPKGDRPKSVETRDYVQYRITIDGTLPVKNDEVVAALAILAGFLRLMDEAPRLNI